MNSEKIKLIQMGVAVFLAFCLIFLGYEIRSLRADVLHVGSLSKAPASVRAVAPAQRPSRQVAYKNPVFDPGVNIFTELSQMEHQMDRLYRRALDRDLGHRELAQTAGYVGTDIREEKDKYVVQMDLPGMQKDNINVEVKDNELLISGERKKDDEQKNANYYAKERSLGYFSQALALPQNADVKGIAVNYDQGVLTIDIPKLAKAQQEKPSTKIKVN